MKTSELISSYIYAKDSNRPHLMAAAFAPDAAVEMVVKVGTIAFPPHAQGLDAISDVFVPALGRHSRTSTRSACVNRRRRACRRTRVPGSWQCPRRRAVPCAWLADDTTGASAPAIPPWSKG